MPTPNHTPLAELTSELARRYPGQPIPTYRQLYNLVLDGKLPTVRVGNRREVDNANFPAIAALFGLKISGDRAAA